MKQSLVTAAIPFDRNKADAVDALLETYIPALRNPGGAIREALANQGVHFMSITVVRGDVSEPTHLLFEMSVDGGEAEAFRVVDARLWDVVNTIFETAGIVRSTPLKEFLAQHQIRVGQGLFDVPGITFCGTPGMSVKRILREWDLSRAVRNFLDTTTPTGSPLAAVQQIREHIAKNDDLKALLSPEPVTRLPLDSGLTNIGLPLIAELAVRGIWHFFWPLISVLGVLVLAAVGIAGADAWHGVTDAGGGIAMAILSTLGAVLVALVIGGLLALVVLIVRLLGIYTRVRVLEEANVPDHRVPDRDMLAKVIAQEDWAAQNHLAGISIMQAGHLRRLTLRIAFWVIGQLAVKRFAPGFLGELGTIHFARWVLLPGTNKLLFFSNYGGSWESYLEDFITKASNGLTGVWSNTVGFPKTVNLFTEGARDGERFKYWARRQQQPSRFWYSAYPRLTTARIRMNAAIRQGLATVSTEDEALAWLTYIGSRLPPPSLIETSDVQTIVFGGLSYHPAAACIALCLPNDAQAACRWLRELEPHISFGDSPPPDRVTILALAASGLVKLGLSEQTRAMFPMAFLQGMAHPVRSEMLADTGDDKPSWWLWGAGDNVTDGAVLAYAADDATLSDSVRMIETSIAVHGGRVAHKVRLTTRPKPDPNEKRTRFAPEEFGFADGMSQPVIRGTKRWMREADKIHTVEPGEFILGYPDNRGFMPPSPTVRATADPTNILTVLFPRHSDAVRQPDFSASGANADRDFGRSGTFLVIRQLEQDVDAFNAYLAKAATDHASHPGLPKTLEGRPERIAEWIGAKMVGRWKDGTSLVRFPHRPGSGWKEGERKREREVDPDNEFLFGKEDPQGQRCPFGAHIRRANPRESAVPDSMEQLSIVNRHRILRIGRGFKAEGSGDPVATKPGLLFMCLNGDIERQFEFIQQTWVMALQFHGLENEVDPILGRGGEKTGRLTIPTAEGPLLISGIKDFVKVRGGGYFFIPGRRALHYLCS
jgi:deferrochelatase/peroxidase EfeB